MFERYIETEDFLEIPLTNSKYFINIKGEVKNYTGNILPDEVDKEYLENL